MVERLVEHADEQAELLGRAVTLPALDLDAVAWADVELLGNQRSRK